MTWRSSCSAFFFFNDTATTEIYTLSLHDALPISAAGHGPAQRLQQDAGHRACAGPVARPQERRCRCRSAPRLIPPLSPRKLHRSEEHTSELQSRLHLVCRLLLEKKKRDTTTPSPSPETCPRLNFCTPHSAPSSDSCATRWVCLPT